MRSLDKAIRMTGTMAICLFVIFSTAFSNTVDSEQNIQVVRNITSMPLAFTANQGQWDEKALFRADTVRY